MSNQVKVFPQTYKKEDKGMDTKVVKEGFEVAQKELRDKQVAEVKLIVTKTLEKIDTLEQERRELREKEKQLEEEIKLLRADIDDLKEGRIDRIIERQEKDTKAKGVSVVVLIKEKETIREVPNSPYPNTWYEPYYVHWTTGTPYIPQTWCTSSDAGSTTISMGGSDNSVESVITNSAAKFAVVGTYTVNGRVINLR